MKSIDAHIQQDQSQIEAAKAEGDMPKVRHLTDELHSLEEYKEHHPGDDHDPTSLEMFCDSNPEAPECRVYDD
ncbi:MAG: CP12 domain-containing protein [Prochlorococcus sp.]|nr:CP12 domain-containing protein [Prochlorococcaceae cyanobacterium Fu_MAG_50]